MTKELKIALAILTVSLVLNFSMYLRMNELTAEVSNISSMVFTEGERLNEVINSVNQIKEDQQWITPVTIQPGALVDGTQEVEFSWQIKDYPLDSPVTFYFRKLGESNFQAVSATGYSDGNFEATIKIEQIEQPEWMIKYKAKDLSQLKENVDSSTYECYITMKEGNQLLSSDIDRVNLGKLEHKYTPLEAVVALQGRNDNEFYIDVYYNEEGIKPVKLYLEIYNANILVDQKELAEVDGENDQKEITWITGDLGFDRLCLKAEYSNHQFFEKEIWKKE